ncbi:MAG: exodeoxyribonuclease VII large subunit [Burkholderiaceae bacterium]|nr:exodeoxyribonuclease VII large subunit [Burkholderiaceae bacterium]
MQNPAVASTYLTVSFKDKDAAKALGARWDGVQRQWYVPEGRELAPFAQWLPAGMEAVSASTSTALSSAQLHDGATTRGANLALAGKKGVSLSSLLAGVSQAVAHAYRAGVWTLVEVVELRANGGHVFMGVSERDASGAVLAKTNAVIWQSTANSILPEFERATGAQLAPGIKLLVRARPVFKPLHGFSIEIDAIDPEYTLGDLEAKKREIRERLQAEGVFAANKQLPPPWDFNAVLVVAPEGGAGLGDFQAEANRLEQFGVCRFTYVYSRFQGEGAAKEICDALQVAIDAWLNAETVPPDAVVIIRGGGAVNDMAWLNDYDLARYICDLNIPVLTGIGHERDNTVLDEVANTRFDTPSKVAAGIEQVISRRTAEAKAHFEGIHNRARQLIQSVKADTVAMESAIRSEGLRHLSQGRLKSSQMMNGIHLDAMQAVRSAAESSRETLQDVKTAAVTQLADAKREVPLAWGQITLGAGHALQSAHALAGGLVGGVLDLTRRVVADARASTATAMDTVGASSRQNLRESKDRSEALIREIAGQGPDKTLKRGFALVRTQDGSSVTRAAQTTTGAALEIEFSDGKVHATTDIRI